MNDFTWITSVILWISCKEKDLAPWSKSLHKRIAHSGSHQFFCDFHAATWSSYRDWNHFTNEWFYVAPFSSFATSMQRHRVRTILGTTWQINDLKRLLSVILSSTRNECGFLLCSKSLGKGIAAPGSRQLLCDFGPQTCSSYRDRSHFVHEWFYVAHFSYFLTMLQTHGGRIVIEVTSSNNAST
jgi:hypothetical protein